MVNLSLIVEMVKSKKEVTIKIPTLEEGETFKQAFSAFDIVAENVMVDGSDLGLKLKLSPVSLKPAAKTKKSKTIYYLRGEYSDREILDFLNKYVKKHRPEFKTIANFTAFGRYMKRELKVRDIKKTSLTDEINKYIESGFAPLPGEPNV